MNCPDIDQLLSQGRSAADLQAMPAARSHIATCPHCAALLRWDAVALPAPEISTPALARIRSIVHHDLKPVTPLPSRRNSLLAAFLLAAILAALHALVFGTRGWLSLHSLQLTALLSLAALAISFAVTSLWSALQPGARRPLPPLLAFLLPAVGFPLLTVLLFSNGSNHDFLVEGAICLTVGLLFAALAAAISIRVARRGYSTNPRLTGALIGAFSGVTGVIALIVSCPNHELAHTAIWHTLVILTAIAAGYRVGARG